MQNIYGQKNLNQQVIFPLKTNAICCFPVPQLSVTRARAALSRQSSRVSAMGDRTSSQLLFFFINNNDYFNGFVYLFIYLLYVSSKSSQILEPFPFEPLSHDTFFVFRRSCKEGNTSAHFGFIGYIRSNVPDISDAVIKLHLGAVGLKQ